ncbi:MAG: vanadium-dependent haloperoxidase [Chitinophagaceae bacterium]
MKRFNPGNTGSGNWRMKIATFLFGNFLLSMWLSSCGKNHADLYPEPPTLTSEKAEAALKWADMTLYTIRFSAFNTPTYSSRSLGYMGLAMYESIIHGDVDHRSMNGQLNGLSLPLPEPGKSYHWILCLNAAQDTLLKLLYPAPGNSHRFIHQRIDSLSNALYAEYSKNISPETIDRSVQFGRSVALAVYGWSLSDGGDKGYTRNFDPNFVFPSGPSYWVPPVRGQTVSPFPLHPHWGDNRTFLKANGNLTVPAILPFSTDTASAYYKMYKDVYDKDHNLSMEEMEIAAWWGDDPTETFSPPGHSYYLATIAIKKADVSVVKAAEAYARTGMAVADAFIHCWKVKTTYFNERASSFVKNYIDPDWIQFWPEPPFPAFPSGHSIQSAAAATVLTELFGEPFSFTDDSHEGHRRYDDIRFLNLRYPARSFSSIWEAANECAYSRFLGGIHTQQDNEVGQQEGRKVGGNINALQWTR